MTEWNFSDEVMTRAKELSIGDRVAVHWSEAECPDQEATVVGVSIERRGVVSYTAHIDGDLSPTDGFYIDHSGHDAGSIRPIDPNTAPTAMQLEDDLEVVAWRYCSHDINGDPWPWEYTDNEGAAIDRAARGFEVEHLIRHHEAGAIITSLRAALREALDTAAIRSDEAEGANALFMDERARAATLQARLDAAVEALKPFAEAGGAIEGAFGAALFPDDSVALGCTWKINGESQSITWADFRKARATLSSLK